MAGKKPSQCNPRSLRYTPKQRRAVIHRTGTAAQVIGHLNDGDHITGLTAGQFSAVDALEHMVNEIGPAAVSLTTWTTGFYDIKRADELKAGCHITDFRVLLDKSTFERSPKFSGPMIEAFGIDTFRCLSVHSKVIIVEGPSLACVFRSSMNLNKNLRTEQFDIDVGRDITEFYMEWFDALWRESGRWYDNRKIIETVYDRFEKGFEEKKEANEDGVLPEDSIWDDVVQLGE